MFHAEYARRQAMEIEQAAMSLESVDWARCRRIYGELVAEMNQIRPALEHFVETRLVP
jgi:protein-histidine pros-kinase